MLQPRDFEQFLALLGEAAALIAADDGSIAAANTEFAAYFGGQMQPLIGRDLAKLVASEDAPALRNLLRREDAAAFHTRCRFLDGEEAGLAALSCDFGPSRFGYRLLRVAGAPAREVPAQDLQQQLNWFREAIDKVGHSIVIFDKDGRVVVYNRFYRDGYRSGDRVLPADIELEGKTYRELMELRVRYKLHKELADDPEKFIEERVRRFDAGTDHTVYLANGSIVLAQYRQLSDGVRVYIGADITQIVETEQRRLEAESANKTKSLFLANMSHELRTPLNAILGFSEVIRDQMMGPADPRYRVYAADIHAAGQHLLKLINDVLDLSKVEVGHTELHDEVVEPAAIVDECCRLVGENVRAGGLRLEMAMPDGLPPLRADRLRLKQILLNILSNAIKFTPAGGRIRVAASCPADGGFMISLADTDIGMRPEDVPKALAPFQQVRDGLTRGHEGVGLGLPLAKALTELHGGTLQIETEPGRGTIVTLCLPAERVLAGGTAPRI